MSVPTHPNATNGYSNGHHDYDEDDHDEEDHDEEDDDEEEYDGQDSDNYMSDEAPDREPELVEVESNEFPSYFEEVVGRLFASSPTPYPLPVDGNEHQRMKQTHDLIHLLFGAHYVAPVPALLAEETGIEKLALDLCTGTGKWVMAMAEEFPHVHFRGFDIVPIATRYPLPRVTFELQDVNSSYRWDDGVFHLVHARDIYMTARNFNWVVGEVARVLRPGGLFVWHEWDGRFIGLDPSYGNINSINIPHTRRFFSTLNNALRTTRHLAPIAHLMPDLIHASGQFASVEATQRQVPIGPWPDDQRSKRIGAAYLETLETFANSVSYVLLSAGMRRQDMDIMLRGYLREMRSTPGLYVTLHTVCAYRA